MFKVLTKGCEPTRGSKYSACVDLYASEDVSIGAGETKFVGLGVCISDDVNFLYHLELLTKKEWSNREIKDFKLSHYLELHPRSSLRTKGLISNTGIIDLDYEDEMKIIIHKPIDLFSIVNDVYDEAYEIKKGDRIAQITLLEHKSYLFAIESEEKRDGGFGSTD